jgi:hypothetical protein
MEFNDFMTLFTKNTKNVFESGSHLFLVDVDKDTLWDTYLESFPPEKNKMFRVRREFDCSCCKSFIRHFGNVVSVKDNKVVTFWDFHTEDDTFEPVLVTMSKLVKSAIVSDVFVTKQNMYGTPVTREYLESKLVHAWNHFAIDIPKNFISTSSLSVNEVTSSLRSVKDVFKRSLEEITKDSLQTVLDLISENSLYRGEEWKAVLDKFVSLQTEYNKLKTNKEKENYVWSKSVEVGGSVGKIRNHSIGTLLVDISNGVEVDEAVRKYEVIIAPTNYKRPKAIFTKKMVEDAQKTLETLGLKDSLGRRHAKISDITINNVLWANRNAKKGMKNTDSIFDELKDEVVVNPKGFEKLQGISVSKFMEQVPTMKTLEVLLENKHENNLMSLISPIEKDSLSLFKWDNSFSWSYNGNIADSMKQRVKSAGGNVEGVLRFSLQWNTENENKNDFDAHCVEPNGNEIYYIVKKVVQPSSGVLDVDIIHPSSEPAVENITWSDERKMPVGKYVFFVHCYSQNGGRTGFEAEIEFDGQIHEFSYGKELRQGEKIIVAEVTRHKDGSFSITNSLPSSITAKSLWNLKTNQFIPVSVFMLSPNYWDEKQGIGNKHYFFILSGCKNETSPNGFYNEYLKEDFMKHNKVFEALGSKMKVENSDTQLSGVGFSSTKQDYVIAKIDGKVTKIIF